jgi:hypothetical protein
MERSFAAIPDELWSPAGFRPRRDERHSLSIAHWLSVGRHPRRFGSRSTCYRRFVEWTAAGVFQMMYVEMLLYYDEERGIDWTWCSLDSASVKAPKGGTSPVPIPPIAASSAPNAMSFATAAASLLPSL